jgi:hypothetical protein
MAEPDDPVCGTAPRTVFVDTLEGRTTAEPEFISTYEPKVSA